MDLLPILWNWISICHNTLFWLRKVTTLCVPKLSIFFVCHRLKVVERKKGKTEKAAGAHVSPININFCSPLFPPFFSSVSLKVRDSLFVFIFPFFKRNYIFAWSNVSFFPFVMPRFEALENHTAFSLFFETLIEGSDKFVITKLLILRNRCHSFHFMFRVNTWFLCDSNRLIAPLK